MCVLSMNKLVNVYVVTSFHCSLVVCLGFRGVCYVSPVPAKDRVSLGLCLNVENKRACILWCLSSYCNELMIKNQTFSF